MRKTPTKSKRGRKPGKSTETLFRLALERLRGKPIGSFATIDGYKFRKTGPNCIVFPG